MFDLSRRSLLAGSAFLVPGAALAAEGQVVETEAGKVFPQFPTYVDITNKLIQPALDKVWNGEATAADALGAIKDQVNAALKAQ